VTAPARVRPPRRAVTGRALVLGALVVVLLVLLASPLHRYFASRSDVSHAAAQLHADQQQLAELQQQQKLWSDPGYVQEQARQRLQYAMPGDTVYVVVHPGQHSGVDAQQQVSVEAQQPTWNQKLWHSVQVAGKK
jgi:cell division protein FtsB